MRVKRVELVENFQCFAFVNTDVCAYLTKTVDNISGVSLTGRIILNIIVGRVVNDLLQVLLPMFIVDAVFSAAVLVSDGELIAEIVQPLQFLLRRQ